MEAAEKELERVRELSKTWLLDGADPEVAEGHAIAVEAGHQPLHSLPYLRMSRSMSIRRICPEKNITASQSTHTVIWRIILIH